MINVRNSKPGFSKHKSGSSAVEFALVFPVFAMLVFGIVTFGAYLTIVHGVQQLAAETARSAIAGLTDVERADLARRNIHNQAGSYPLINPQRLFIEHAGTDPSTGTFRVRLRYDADDLFLFQLPTMVPMPSRQVIRSAAVQRGGF
ncbi:TadE/TadG family type IV pilus assembly protein [Phreatobacter sp.]|uniref:TadE/TadG family type IV pilus assembly protein n=1 Tax=Phreatobacter sp. TaxID=1966341 RepID=UPI003F71F9E8